MPSMTLQSADMRRLRRQQQDCRMRTSLAPAAGGVAKKSPSPRLCQEESPAHRADGDTDTHVPLLAASSPRHPAAPASDNKDPSPVISLRLGTQVKVRTPTRTYITGRRLLFWLHAVVVDALEEEDNGCVKVVYSNYAHPASDALGVVRVLKKDVKHMVPPVPAAAAAGSSSSVTTSHSPASSSPSKGKGRPTVAGKKPLLLKKMEEEMWRKSEAILDSS